METCIHLRLCSGGPFALCFPCDYRLENYRPDKPRGRSFRSKRLCRNVQDDGRLVVSVVFGRDAQPPFSLDRRDTPRFERRRILRKRKALECGAWDFRDGGCLSLFRLPCRSTGGVQCVGVVLIGGPFADSHLLRCRTDLSRYSSCLSAPARCVS